MSSSYHRSKPEFCTFSSLTTLEFKWLLPEAWGVEQWSFWVAARSKFFTPQFCHPGILATKSSKNKLLSSEWILVDTSGKNIGWAQAHAFTGAYQVLQVALGVDEAVEGDEVSKAADLLPRALSFLVSGLLLAFSADLVKLSSAQPALEPVLAGLDPKVEPRVLWSPLSDLGEAWTLPLEAVGVFVRQWQFGAQAWWELERTQSERKALRYLELRRQNQQALAAQSCCCRPPRSGLLGGFGRLFGRRKK